MSTPASRLVLRASTQSARLEIVAEERADIEVDGQAAPAADGVVTVATSSAPLRVRVPVGTELVVGTTSGRVRVEGPAGPVKVATESGRIEIEAAERVDIRTTSGRVEVDDCAAGCRVHSESGRVNVRRAGGLDAHTSSGRVSVEAARGDVRVQTTSGRVSVGLDAAAVVDAETVSGRIDLTVESGLGVRLDEGSEGRRVSVDADVGDDCVVRTRSVSGRIRVRGR